MDAAAELGRNPVSKHQIQPEYGDEQADAGRVGCTRLARPSSQARTGTGEYYFPCSADHEQDWQPYPVDPYSAICDEHTYILLYSDTVRCPGDDSIRLGRTDASRQNSTTTNARSMSYRYTGVMLYQALCGVQRQL